MRYSPQRQAELSPSAIDSGNGKARLTRRSSLRIRRRLGSNPVTLNPISKGFQAIKGRQEGAGVELGGRAWKWESMMTGFQRNPWLVLASSLLVGVPITDLGAQALATQSAMHARVQDLYSFSPSKVTAEARESKSKEMDSFWDELKNNQDVELPILRKELQDASNPAFFFADASGLLLSLSHAPEDEALAIAALTRVDFTDFQSRQYLYEVHGLAVNGANVTPAALHMLDDPKFAVFLPEHGAYKLDQGACLQVMLLPLSTDVWLPAVLERTTKEQDETAMKSLLLLLFYAQTDEGDRAIKSVAGGAERSAAIRGFAREIVKHESELGLGKNPSRLLEDKLREERRKRMAAVSDEAMGDLDDMTNKIARARRLSR